MLEMVSACSVRKVQASHGLQLVLLLVLLPTVDVSAPALHVHVPTQQTSPQLVLIPWH